VVVIAPPPTLDFVSPDTLPLWFSSNSCGLKKSFGEGPNPWQSTSTWAVDVVPVTIDLARRRSLGGVRFTTARWETDATRLFCWWGRGLHIPKPDPRSILHKIEN